MNSFIQIVSNKRPSLSPSSIKTYSFTLASIYKDLGGKMPIDVNVFNNTPKILEIISSKPLNTQSTTLSALNLITDRNPAYVSFASNIKILLDQSKTQMKNQKQSETWINQTEIENIFNKYEQEADNIYKSKTFTASNLQLIQNYIILALTSGIYIPPRRSLDWTEFKIKNVNKQVDNFLDKNKVIFNQFKTVRTYGQQHMEIPKLLALHNQII